MRAASGPLRLVLAAAASLALQPVAAAPRSETPPRSELAHSCSRAVSRQVRKQLERDVLRPATRAGLEAWPKGCPLDPSRDLYAQHERQKHRKRGSGSLWTCGICGKTFRSEHYLDLHLERMHMNLTPMGGICVAEYCEIFEACHGDTRFKRPHRERDELSACNDTMLAGVRRRCEEAMAKCFPLGHEVSRRLHAQFSRQWCQVLDCKIRKERQQEHHHELMPVVVLLILVILICFIVFSIVVCCVDYSDDILLFLVESRIASADSVRRLLRARERTRETMGMDRTKRI
eukprot:CAMPEP_0171078334 /NCGR_PEP_ID=MMETSP0766_2-20121228/14583_1 /TAXON_ID=439317 /ORGANISM="Gambierdiscus australes, Strain CAWD 149" /LENGTH=288 /DNA_ID=CAMNT_0011535457 /DNA_START=51 /DNA_END=917 /DNA_ORIENTATION=+